MDAEPTRSISGRGRVSHVLPRNFFAASGEAVFDLASNFRDLLLSRSIVVSLSKLSAIGLSLDDVYNEIETLTDPNARSVFTKWSQWTLTKFGYSRDADQATEIIRNIGDLILAVLGTQSSSPFDP